MCVTTAKYWQYKTQLCILYFMCKIRICVNSSFWKYFTHGCAIVNKLVLGARLCVTNCHDRVLQNNAENCPKYCQVHSNLLTISGVKLRYFAPKFQVVFFCRATLCVSAVLVGRCLSVRPSRSCIVSKPLKIWSDFFLGLVAPSF